MAAPPRFTSLLDGSTLTGWTAVPPRYGQLYPGGPDVLDVVTDFEPDYPERGLMPARPIGPLRTARSSDGNSRPCRPSSTTASRGRSAVSEVLGRRGHIALEVHDNDPILGADRWAPEARCRWRNIFIREL